MQYPYPKILKAKPSVMCFGKFPVAKKFLDEKGGGYRNFPSKNFCPKVMKKVVGDPFSVSLTFGIEKTYASEGYVTIFHLKFIDS